MAGAFYVLLLPFTFSCDNHSVPQYKWGDRPLLPTPSACLEMVQCMHKRTMAHITVKGG